LLSIQCIYKIMEKRRKEKGRKEERRKKKKKKKKKKKNIFNTENFTGIYNIGSNVSTHILTSHH